MRETEKRILIVPESLARRIDENRGDMGRAEFIDYCIDALLKTPHHEAYATKEELEDFKKSIKTLLKSFIDFTLSYDLELSKVPRKELEEVEEEIKSLKREAYGGERYGAKEEYATREERYATREEFSDFKKEMKNMLSSFFGLYEELKGEALGRKIERLLPQIEEYEKPESPKKEYNYESRFVPRSECEAFKREIRDMLLSFKEDLKNFREELKRKERPFVYEEPRVIYRERPIIYEEPKYREEPRVIPRERVEAHEEPRREPERREEPEKRGVWEKLEDIPAALWVPAIVLFGFGDTLTSQLVFAAGGKEANPVMGAITAFPGGIWGFAFVKTIILVSLIFLSATFFGRQQWIVPTILCFVGAYLVFHNLVTLFQLIGGG